MPQDHEFKSETKEVEQLPIFSADGGEHSAPPQTPLLNTQSKQTPSETDASYVVEPVLEVNAYDDETTQKDSYLATENPIISYQPTVKIPEILPAQKSYQPPVLQKQASSPQISKPYQSLTPYIRPPMDPVRYHYLTTPPPLERQSTNQKNRYAVSQGGWWGGSVSNNWQDANKWVFAVVGSIVLIALLFLFLNRSIAQPVIQNQEVSEADTATITPFPTVPTYSSSPTEELVSDNEKWGTVLVNNANIRAVPLDSGNVNQKLKQNTLLAFEKKVSSGWYMLAGGGWIKREEVKVFPTKESALEAVAQFQATATAAASANPLLAITPTPAVDNSSPADLSAKGALNYQTLNCNIKGEISTNEGIKTYYLPVQAAYNSLSMLPIDNHRWFCSEQDATNNGFIKSTSPVLPTIAPTPTFGITQRLPTVRPTSYFVYSNTPSPSATNGLATPSAKP